MQLGIVPLLHKERIMQRPISQHLFALAAEAERIVLALRGIQAELDNPSENIDLAAQALDYAVSDLLEAGNEFKDLTP